jgi:hypothetical protein
LVEILDINNPLTPSFEPFWFNSEEYAIQSTAGRGMLFHYQKEAIQIFLRAYEKEGFLISPLRAPFGAFEFSTGTNQEIFYEFVKELLQKVKSMPLKGIKITAAPECYDLAKADLMDEILIHAGFSVSVTELNYHIETTSGVFEEFVHPSEKRRLKKCLNAGFESKVDPNPDYKLIHRLITDCRERKGYPLSMNASDFEKMFQDFPQRYLPFVVKDGTKIIAAAIGVKVRSDILYNFLPADHKDYLDYSPTVLLNKTMYEYCRENHYKLYDLGIATAGGIRNEGLIRFKEHLGGVLSHKYSYEIIF